MIVTEENSGNKKERTTNFVVITAQYHSYLKYPAKIRLYQIVLRAFCSQETCLNADIPIRLWAIQLLRLRI